MRAVELDWHDRLESGTRVPTALEDILGLTPTRQHRQHDAKHDS
jgi:hypothetical protein